MLNFQNKPAFFAVKRKKKLFWKKFSSSVFFLKNQNKAWKKLIFSLGKISLPQVIWRQRRQMTWGKLIFSQEKSAYLKSFGAFDVKRLEVMVFYPWQNTLPTREFALKAKIHG